jgi:PAS domain-containing protein
MPFRTPSCLHILILDLFKTGSNVHLGGDNCDQFGSDEVRRRPRQVLLALSDQSQGHDSKQFLEALREEDGEHTSRPQGPAVQRGGRDLRHPRHCYRISKNAEEESARRFSEERYSVVVETANDAVLKADETGAILFPNSSTAKIFGYDSTELIGKRLTMLIPEFIHK